MASTIRLALPSEIKYGVLEETKSNELWQKLEKTMFQSKSLASKLLLKKDFFSFGYGGKRRLERSHQHVHWIDHPIGLVG